MSEIEKSRKFIEEILPEIRNIILKYYKTGFHVELKADLSPVTVADRETEDYIRRKIMENFPDHGIIGEESGDHLPYASYKWIIDPIDGTKSFVAGVPLYGTLIALVHENKPVLGCIFLPVSNETLIGDNSETWLNGKKVAINSNVPLEDSVVLTTDYKDFSKYKPREGFEELLTKCRLSRTWGDCYGYYLLVSGSAHVMIDPAMSVWDKMALIPIIRGAGGIITDFYGNPPEDGDGIVASTKNLHQEVISLLNKK